MVPQSVTKTAASTDTTTYQEVFLNSGSDSASAEACIPSQALRVGVGITDPGTTGTCTIRFVLRDAATVYKVVDCTVTNSLARQGPAGAASGPYVGTVVATNADFIDLIGYSEKDGIKWYVGLSALVALTSVTIYLWPTRAI